MLSPTPFANCVSIDRMQIVRREAELWDHLELNGSLQLSCDSEGSAKSDCTAARCERRQAMICFAS
jgi:hypothetical protein